MSHVEPEEDGWTATMIDGTKLGPFQSRQTALDAEIKYLEGKLFGIPGADEASKRFLYCREYDNKENN